MCTKCDYSRVGATSASVVSVLCDDGNPYTTDTCDDETGCVYTPMYHGPHMAQRYDGLKVGGTAPSTGQERETGKKILPRPYLQIDEEKSTLDSFLLQTRA